MKVEQRKKKYGEASSECKCALRILDAMEDPQSVMDRKAGGHDDEDGRTQIVFAGGDEQESQKETELALCQDSQVPDESGTAVVGHEEQNLGLMDFAGSISPKSSASPSERK